MKTKITSILLLLTSLGTVKFIDGFVVTTPVTSSLSYSIRSGDAICSSSPSSLFVHHEEEDISENLPSASRKTGLTHETSLSKTFATGEDLKNLRFDLESLRQNLLWAKALKDENRMDSLNEAIEKGQKRDPSFMYDKAIRLIEQAKVMKDAKQEEKDALIEKWTEVAAQARECLPQFNLEGLWVGNYGKHGPQVINITYTPDDIIVATKVTGDRNVPRGETSYTVDLSPCNASALPPIQLVSDQRSGEFERFPGRGQVSRKGFKDNRYVEGQMILFEDQFSFVWIPTKHHVLFTRPSPEMTLRLLRDTISKEDELENQRKHLERCMIMDLSTCIARQQDPNIFEPLRRIATQKELDEERKQFEQRKNERNIFWQINKWRKYIDQSLDGV